VGDEVLSASGDASHNLIRVKITNFGMDMDKELPSKISFLQTLNPLTKFVILIALTVVVFFARSPWILGGVLLYDVVLLGGRGIHMGRLKWLFVPFLLSVPVTLAVFVISYWIEFSNFEEGLWRGLSDSGLFLMRILVLLMANIMFVRTTDMRRLGECLNAIHVPYTIVLLITTVFRFLPLIVEEVHRIVEVQRSRGLRPINLLLPRCFLPLVIPLLLINMQRAHDMALSMEMRGRMQKTRSIPLSLRWTDWTVIALNGAIVLITLGI